MPHFGYIDSYDPNAPIPRVGTRWVWEIDSDSARALIEVITVKWNGEEWWVRTRDITPDVYSQPNESHWNDVGRFWEAVTIVGGALTGQVVWRRPDAARPLEEICLV